PGCDVAEGILERTAEGEHIEFVTTDRVRRQEAIAAASARVRAPIEGDRSGEATTHHDRRRSGQCDRSTAARTGTRDGTRPLHRTVERHFADEGVPRAGGDEGGSEEKGSFVAPGGDEGGRR